MNDTTKQELTLSTKFNAFDTTVEVLFWNTKDAISDIQKKSFDSFVTKQDLLSPEILKKIFEFYKEAYPSYKKGWEFGGGLSKEELEENLPEPTTPEKLKAFITPAIVYIPSSKNCKVGTFGIEFDCTWDIKSGLGVAIKDWKVVEVGVAETAYVN